MNFEFQDMPMDTKRSRALHNFTFPGSLRWGNQISLRCIKVESDSQVSPLRELTSNGSDSSGNRHHQQSSQLRKTSGDGGRENPDSDFVFLGFHQMVPTPPQVTHGVRGIGEDESNGITAVRENVMFDRQKAADKLKDSISKEGHEGGEVSVSPQSLTPHPAAMPAEGDANRPWNLRKRRAACKTPASGFVIGVNGGASYAGVGGMGMRADGARPGSEISLIKAAAAVTGKSLRSGGNGCGQKRKREKFSVTLSKREIEEDFLSFAGHKPPRRPKKRNKIVQRELDTLFPGLWLTEITPDLYKVSGGAP